MLATGIGYAVDELRIFVLIAISAVAGAFVSLRSSRVSGVARITLFVLAIVLLSTVARLSGEYSFPSGRDAPRDSPGPESGGGAEAGPTTSLEQRSPQPEVPPRTTPATDTRLYDKQPLVLRDRGCGPGAGGTYVTLDDPPSVGKSSSPHDVFEYGSCARDVPTIRVSDEIEASPLEESTRGRDACIAALRSDEAPEETPASQGVALCFRTPGGTIAMVIVDQVGRDGRARVLATGWKDE